MEREKKWQQRNSRMGVAVETRIGRGEKKRQGVQVGDIFYTVVLHIACRWLEKKKERKRKEEDEEGGGGKKERRGVKWAPRDILERCKADSILCSRPITALGFVEHHLALLCLGVLSSVASSLRPGERCF